MMPRESTFRLTSPPEPNPSCETKLMPEGLANCPMPSRLPAVPRLKVIVCAVAPENVTLAVLPPVVADLERARRAAGVAGVDAVVDVPSVRSGAGEEHRDVVRLAERVEGARRSREVAGRKGGLERGRVETA